MGYNQLIVLMTVIFTIIICAIGIGDLIKKKYSYFVENAVSYILYIIFLALQYRFNFFVNPFIIFLALITIIGNNFIGKYLNFYYRSKHFDRYLHGFGAFSYALFFYDIIDKTIRPAVNSTLYVSIFVAALGISYACIYEIYEFIMDSVGNSDHQHGLKDTNFDLLSNVIGAIIAGVISNVFFF